MIIVLVALEPRAYREAIGLTIRELRPNVDVVIDEPVFLFSRIVSLHPQVVICGRACVTLPDGVLSWIELELSDGMQVAKVCASGTYMEFDDVQFDDLLSLIDHTEDLQRAELSPARSRRY